MQRWKKVIEYIFAPREPKQKCYMAYPVSNIALAPIPIMAVNIHEADEKAQAFEKDGVHIASVEYLGPIITDNGIDVNTLL